MSQHGAGPDSRDDHVLPRESGASVIDALTLARLRAAHLRQLAETLSLLLEPQGIVDTLVQPLSALLPTVRGSVSLLNWDRMVVEQVQPLSEATVGCGVVPGWSLTTDHPWCEVAASGQALFTSHRQDLLPLPDTGRAEPPPTTPFALALVPLPGRERAHGMLTLEISGEYTFDYDEQTFLLSLAALAGQALDRAFLAEEQRALRGMVEERNIELRSYTYALSHNIGEPIQRIGNFFKLMDKQLGAQLDAQTQRLFNLARQETERITERILELRMLTLIDHQELQLETLDLTVLLVQVRHDLEPLTHARKVQWQVPSLPKIQGDTLLMWQVLMEVLAFVVEDAWDAEPPVIRVEAQEEGDQVVLCLQGNGQGFQEVLNERIFDVLDHSVPRKTALGRLGLSNVRRALGRQGGWAWAEGRPGEGARFWVTLRRAGETLAA